MTLTVEELHDIADAFVRSIETGDSSLFDHIRGDTMVTWHNHDRVETTYDPVQNDGPARLHAVLRDIRVELTSLQRCDRGVLIEWIMRATLRHSGVPFELHNCMVFTLRHGKVVRANEYVDPNLFTYFPGASATVAAQ